MVYRMLEVHKNQYLRALGLVVADFVEEKLLDWIRNLLKGWSGDAKVAFSDRAQVAHSRKQL